MKLFKIALSVLVLVGIGTGVFIYRPQGQVEQEGPATVIAADLIEIAGVRHRLAGIVVPLADQQCVDRKGQTWPCGQQAVDGLRKLVTGTPVLCRLRPGKTDLSDCYVGDKHLSERMVWAGWALACRYGTADFSSSESSPRFIAVGLWRGGFEPPTHWINVRGEPVKSEAAWAFMTGWAGGMAFGTRHGELP